MLDFNTDHKALAWTMFLVFLALTIGIAIYPAFKMQDDYGPLPDQPEMSQEERRGEEIYIAEGCVACHTQQVRNIEMDNTWGDRPAMPEDYYYSKKREDVWRQSPSLLGSERTGPDLTNIGERQPSEDWQFLHLYEPRALVDESIMPGFQWLFDVVDSSMVRDDDVTVDVPSEYFDKPGKAVVATDKAEALVAYLVSLKQPDVPEDREIPEFIPFKEKDEETASSGDSGSSGPDGEKLYEDTCVQCHQADGDGVEGSFPSLHNSAIVNDDNPETHIKVVLEGKDDDPDYGPMPPQGAGLSDEEVAAIINYERSNWDNDGEEVSEDDVKEVRDEIE